MTGGLMQLVAYGAQDVYLTGNPQITLFKVVYRRHTNFSVECSELSLDTAKPGGRPTIQVLRNGDLATRSYLRVTLPPLAPSNSRYEGQVAWVRRLGHAMIKSVEIQIGGSPIDKHYGTWLDVWYELTHTTSQERGYRAMIGDVDQLTKLQTSVAGYTLFVPLQFWFCRNYGLALPLIALQYHDVRLNFEFEELDRLVVSTKGAGLETVPKFQSFQYASAAVLIDYVYLDSEERRRFAQVGHEYLIEQLQTPGEQNLAIQGTGSSPTNQTFTLNFNHPCKEFIWAHKLGAFNGNGGYFLAYSNQDQWIGGWENAVQDAATSLARASVSVEAVEPWLASDASVATFNLSPVSDPISINTMTNGTVWKFIATNTAGLSSGDTQQVHILMNPITLGSINLGDHLLDITVELDFQDVAIATPKVTVSVSSHKLSLINLSIPLANGFTSPFADRRLDEDKSSDVNVIIPHNYGAVLDGTGNIVKEGKIELNGHDRFTTREGSYFNYVQPYQHHTRTPADGINVYSFALHPEQHQPTGTGNMSRIDSVKLNYKTQDPVRNDTKLYAPLNYTLDTTFHIFATNYNVLRIMSGMGGLAYSN